MSLYWLSLVGAIVSGLITSISPCPMTTNIAAISYIGRQTGDSRKLLISGLLYAFGRSFAYAALAFCIVSLTLFSGETITRWFAARIHFWIGPPLILLGMFLCGLLSINLNIPQSDSARQLADRFGVFSAFPVGILFALAFCPTSAAAFIALRGLAAQARSTVWIPAAFGLATAAPVFGFTVILAYAPHLIGVSFAVMPQIDRWARSGRQRPDRRRNLLFVGVRLVLDEPTPREADMKKPMETSMVQEGFSDSFSSNAFFRSPSCFLVSVWVRLGIRNIELIFLILLRFFHGVVDHANEILLGSVGGCFAAGGRVVYRAGKRGGIGKSGCGLAVGADSPERAEKSGSD